MAYNKKAFFFFFVKPQNETLELSVGLDIHQNVKLTVYETKTTPQQWQYDKANMLQFFLFSLGRRSQLMAERQQTPEQRCWVWGLPGTVSGCGTAHRCAQQLDAHPPPSAAGGRGRHFLRCPEHPHVLPLAHTSHRNQVHEHLQESHTNHRTLPGEMSHESAMIYFRALPAWTLHLPPPHRVLLGNKGHHTSGFLQFQREDHFPLASEKCVLFTCI